MTMTVHTHSPDEDLAVAVIKGKHEPTAELLAKFAGLYLEARGELARQRHRHAVDFDNWKHDRERLETSGPAELDGEHLWRWQSDGHNHLESLTCPVVISADDLRDLVDTRMQLRVGSVVVLQTESTGILGDHRITRSSPSGICMQDVESGHEVTFVLKRY